MSNFIRITNVKIYEPTMQVVKKEINGEIITSITYPYKLFSNLKRNDTIKKSELNNYRSLFKVNSKCKVFLEYLE